VRRSLSGEQKGDGCENQGMCHRCYSFGRKIVPRKDAKNREGGKVNQKPQTRNQKPYSAT